MLSLWRMDPKGTNLHFFVFSLPFFPMFFNQIMYSSYSLLVTVVLLFLLFSTNARLSQPRNERTIDDRRESPATTSRHQRKSRRLFDNTRYTDVFRDSNMFDGRMANASASLSAFAYCANDTIVSFKVHSPSFLFRSKILLS